MSIADRFRSVADDVRLAVRTMRRQRRFVFFAGVLLALGIGASSAIFIILEALVFRQLPVINPDELVQFEQVYPNGPQNFFSSAKFQYLRDHNKSFVEIFAWSRRSGYLGTDNDVAPGIVTYVSGNYYLALGVPTFLGRPIAPQDDQPDAPPVAVISHDLWHGRFGANPQIIGHLIRVNGMSATIIGVDPPWFSGAEVGVRPEVTVPLAVQPLLNPKLPLAKRSVQWLKVMARLRRGVGEKQAGLELAALWPRILSELEPQSHNVGTYIAMSRAGNGLSQLRQQFSKPLYILLAVAGLLVLIVCGNLTSLLLARAQARYREIAVQLAVGATRIRLARQLLTESILLSFVGGLGGFAFALIGSRGLIKILTLGRPGIYLSVGADLHVVEYVFLITLGAAIIFGIAPALQVSKMEIGQGLRNKADSIKGTEHRLGRMLVSAQIASCFVLLVGAGLIGRSLKNLLTVAPGFNPGGVVLAHIDTSQTGYRGVALAELYTRILSDLRILPGIQSASLSTVPPLTGGGGVVYEANTVSVDGQPAQPALQGHLFSNSVSSGFFKTLEIPLLAGRDFDARDDQHGVRVIVVSEHFARTFFENAGALGHRIQIDSDAPAEIVGVVRDSRYENLREKPALVIYRPYWQDPDALAGIYVEIKSLLPVSDLSATVEHKAKSLAGAVPISATPLTTWLDLFLVPERLMATLLSSFALVALVLSSGGLYAVMSHFIARRRGEIAIRVVLGARPIVVVWLILRDILLVVFFGFLIGGISALIGSRALSSMLYGLKEIDAATFIGVALVLTGVSLLAAYFPIRTAIRIDPNVALRCE